jgi:hypothetical protein
MLIGAILAPVRRARRDFEQLSVLSSDGRGDGASCCCGEACREGPARGSAAGACRRSKFGVWVAGWSGHGADGEAFRLFGV